MKTLQTKLLLGLCCFLIAGCSGDKEEEIEKGDKDKGKTETKKVSADTAMELATNGRIRCEAIGKKFPLEFTDQTGKEYQSSDFDGDPVLVTILGKGLQFDDQIVFLQEVIAYRERDGIQLILLLHDTEQKELQTLAERFEGQVIIVGHPVIDSEIHKAFPVTQPPAYLFLDGNQNMVNLTRKTQEAITRLESLIFEVNNAN